MELTWPIDTYCWISTEKDTRWDENYDTTVYLSSRDGNVYGACIFYARGSCPMMVHANFWRYKFYEPRSGKRSTIYNENNCGPFYLSDVQRQFEQAITQPQWGSNCERVYCDVPQKIIAAVCALPQPIAEEIIPHLRASVRAVAPGPYPYL